jgi:hypothetical protein
MKKIIQIFVILFLFSLFVLSPLPVLAQDPTPGNNFVGDQLVIGNTYRLAAGDTLTGNLAIVGGTAAIEVDAKMIGDIILSGGTLSLAGTVDGDIIAIGGAVTLEDTAVVNGNMVLIGATINRSPLAIIKGEITEQSPSFFNFKDTGKVLTPFASAKDPLTRALSITFQALAISALAVILGLLLPEQIKRVSSTLTAEPLIAGGVGSLTVVVFPIVLVILTITIILIPVAILAILLFIFALLYGWITAGHEIGTRIAALFKTDWHPAIDAGIGSLVLSLVAGFASMIPCAGWLVGLFIALFGLGAVLISRFGSAKYANKLINSVLPQKSTEIIDQPATKE